MSILLILFLSLCGLGILWGIYRLYKYYQKAKIMADNLHTLLANGAIIIDVRSSLEYQMSHIDGSINLPLERLLSEHTSLSKEQVYISTCLHGVRSMKALEILRNLGYEVHNGGAYKSLAAHLSLPLV